MRLPWGLGLLVSGARDLTFDKWNLKPTPNHLIPETWHVLV